ncbi:MAG TPA: hypothetical protein VLH13_03640 [Methanomassiliicoccales archaeon]|nr:hypothetical protein [Methanomassiliicoccales archaeon]
MKGSLRRLGIVSMLSVMALSGGGIFIAVLSEQSLDQRYRFLCFACGAISSCSLAWGAWSGRTDAWYASMGLQIFIVVVPYSVWSDASLLYVWLISFMQFAAAIWGGRSTPAQIAISDVGFDEKGERAVARAWMVSWLRNAALLFSAFLIGLLMISLTSVISQDGVPLWAVAFLSLMTIASLAYLAMMRR